MAWGRSMKRNIENYLFRAKCKDSKEWAYGNLYSNHNDQHEIILYTNSYYNRYALEIDPDTTGQYIGITDICDNNIFEGDIVHCYGGNCYFGVWEYDEIIAVKTIFDYEQMFYLKQADYIEILGNIYDNPELIKKEV